MKWHWIRDKEVLEENKVYWDRGTNNNDNYFTKHHPSIHHRQIQPRYIHTSNLARKIPQTIRLFKGVFNQVPFTQYFIDSLKMIQAEPQYMTKKYPTV